MLELRAAASHDRDFLWELHRTALRPAVEATWGWDEAFQLQYFAEHFTTSDRLIVCVDGVDAGVLQFAVEGDHLLLASVALVPEHQGRGIGTDLVNMVLADGRRHNLPVRLQVLKVNRAKKLYERLGFEAYAESETHVHMERVGGPEWIEADGRRTPSWSGARSLTQCSTDAHRRRRMELQ